MWKVRRRKVGELREPPLTVLDAMLWKWPQAGARPELSTGVEETVDNRAHLLLMGAGCSAEGRMEGFGLRHRVPALGKNPDNSSSYLQVIHRPPGLVEWLDHAVL